MLTFECGGFHHLPNMTFETVAQVWEYIEGLKKEDKLFDLVCIDSLDEDHEIVDAPYDQHDIPGIIEEKVDESTQLRRWMLRIS